MLRIRETGPHAADRLPLAAERQTRSRRRPALSTSRRYSTTPKCEGTLSSTLNFVEKKRSVCVAPTTFIRLSGRAASEKRAGLSAEMSEPEDSQGTHRVASVSKRKSDVHTYQTSVGQEKKHHAAFHRIVQSDSASYAFAATYRPSCMQHRCKPSSHAHGNIARQPRGSPAHQKRA